jgi:hypothetical protein
MLLISVGVKQPFSVYILQLYAVVFLYSDFIMCQIALYVKTIVEVYACRQFWEKYVPLVLFIQIVFCKDYFP